MLGRLQRGNCSSILEEILEVYGCLLVSVNPSWDILIKSSNILNNRKGLTGKQAEFAVKKYKSHRRVGKQVMMDIG